MIIQASGYTPTSYQCHLDYVSLAFENITGNSIKSLTKAELFHIHWLPTANVVKSAKQHLLHSIVKARCFLSVATRFNEELFILAPPPPPICPTFE